jgi:hypothetical protein
MEIFCFTVEILAGGGHCFFLSLACEVMKVNTLRWGKNRALSCLVNGNIYLVLSKKGLNHYKLRLTLAFLPDTKYVGLCLSLL